MSLINTQIFHKPERDNVIMENFEQWEANQPEEMRPRIIERRDLGNGKSEVS